MATITKRKRKNGDVSYRARYIKPDGTQGSLTRRTRMEADKAAKAIENGVDRGEWLDPKRGKITVGVWADRWIDTRADLRASTLQRLEGVIRLKIKPKFGNRRLSSLSNSEVRAWVKEMQDQGEGTSTIRKSVFALRQMLDAAIADRRLTVNAAANVDLPAETQGEQRFLTRTEVDSLIECAPQEYQAMILLAAYAGLRWGELTALRRSDIDTLRSRVSVSKTAVQVKGSIEYNEPKTKKSNRVVPVGRVIMRQVEDHLANFVAPESDALLFTWESEPIWRGTFSREVWRPLTIGAGLAGFRFHDLRHTFVSMMIAAGANPKEVSTWAGHSSVAFTLDRYGHLYDDQSDDVVNRLDAMLSGGSEPKASVSSIR